MQTLVVKNNLFLDELDKLCSKDSNVEIIFDKNILGIETIIDYINDFVIWESDKLNGIEDDVAIINVCPIFENLSFDDKVVLLNNLVDNENVNNSALLFNIYLFIRSNDGFEVDEMFNNNYVIIKTIEEFLDIKIAIKDSISKLLNNIAIYYLAVLSSLHVTPDQGLIMGMGATPIKYSQLIKLLSFNELSRIISKCENITIDDIPKIYDAQHIWETLMYKEQPTVELFKSLTNYLKETFDEN